MATTAEILGRAWQCQQAGRHTEAEQLCQLVVRAEPFNADAWCLHGVVSHAQGKVAQAEAQLRRAVLLAPTSARSHNLLGAVILGQRRYSEAEACFQTALRLEPNHADACANLGSVFEMRMDFEAAMDRYWQALEQQPDHFAAHCNLGIVLDKLGQPEEAIGHFQLALARQPNHPDCLNSLGNALKNVHRMDEALDCFERALHVQPSHAEAHMSRAALWLLQGDYQRGWPEYEWRWQQAGITANPLPQPLWDGSDLAGKRILLWAEQGYGDTIQFVRYATLAKQRGGHVILGCQAPMERVLTSAAGINQLIVEGAELPAFDVQAPLGSLPGIFRTTLETIPAAVPYLNWSPSWSPIGETRWRPKGRLRIGIAWQGNPKHRDDRKRSIPLVQFAPLARLEGVELISLQKGPGADQLRAQAVGFPVRDLEDRLGGVDESLLNIAAIMKNLDLVISCDSAVAHLAGALGVRVWVALPVVPDWRWLLEREEIPWYPTMRLFRQTRWREWEEVFHRITMELSSAAVGPLAVN